MSQGLGEIAVGAAAFAIALAWNSAITGSIKRVYPEHKTGANFAYAVVITLVVIVVYACATHSIRYAKRVGLISVASVDCGGCKEGVARNQTALAMEIAA
ncbi:MAG: hypothetical protein KGL39_01455 [Patescibacteria group bacterium]|nr:hypothetical protein [Patescibacteria group bacterium]